MKMAKNITHETYKDYSVDNLVQDDYFIRSMVNPTEESNTFWKGLVEKGVFSYADFQMACSLFNNFQTRSDTLSDEEANLLWQKIKCKNNILKEEKKRRRSYFFFGAIGSVASLLLLFVHLKFTSPVNDANLNSSIESMAAFANSFDDVQLVLANDEVLSLNGQIVNISYGDKNITVNNDTELKKQVNANGSTAYNQLIVPKGKRSTLSFEDGSKIWINAGTRVVYPAVFTDSKREIYVDGEVFLDVSRDEKRPFMVKSKDFQVEVLGTSFNFMAYELDESQHVVLISGEVKVKAKSGKEIILSPNEMFLIKDDILQVEKVDVSTYTSWKTGMYQYHSERLDVIMKRLSRYYGKEISCSSEVAHLKCTGKLDLKNNLDSVLQGISRTAPICYQIKDGKYIIANK